MKIIFPIIISTFLIYGCSKYHLNQKSIIGTYYQQSDSDEFQKVNLIITDNKFVMIDATNYSFMDKGNSKYICCDTVSHGTWVVDKEHRTIAFSTHIGGTFVKDTVEESFFGSKDTVYFCIKNPIENNMGKLHRNIFYVIDLNSIGSDFGNNLLDKEYNTNAIAIPNLEHARILNFSISIYVKPEYLDHARFVAMNPIKTYNYQVKIRDANHFIVKIPKLTYQYITYLRFKERLGKLEKNDTIVLDGVTYRKK